MSDAFEYVGDELEVFAGTVHWKRYFAVQLRPFIRGHISEVGAGLGSTTKMLHQGARLTSFLRQREPDFEINYSTLVYRLGAEDLARALDGPPSEMRPVAPAEEAGPPK